METKKAWEEHRVKHALALPKPDRKNAWGRYVSFNEVSRTGIVVFITQDL
jgi:hypothetical protein